MSEVIATACVACIGLLAIVVVLIERQLSRRIRQLQEEVSSLSLQVMKAHGSIGSLTRTTSRHGESLAVLIELIERERQRCG